MTTNGGSSGELVGAPPERLPPAPGEGARQAAIALTALGPVFCLMGSVFGVFSVMATDSCGSGCGAGAGWGISLMIFAPWVVWLLFGGWAVVQLVRKRPALSIVITGIVLSVVIYVLANVMLSMSI